MMGRLVTPPRRPVPFAETIAVMVEQDVITKGAADMILRRHKEALDFAVKGGRIALAATIQQELQNVINKEGI